MKDITIKPNITIRQAMQFLNNTGTKCLLVVDDENKLLLCRQHLQSLSVFHHALLSSPANIEKLRSEQQERMRKGGSRVDDEEQDFAVVFSTSDGFFKSKL